MKSKSKDRIFYPAFITHSSLSARNYEADMPPAPAPCEPLHRPASRTIVYEMHVRGFTRHPSHTYYILEAGGGRYANFTGCGNTFNGNHPIVRRLIVDSLRLALGGELRSDGFHFHFILNAYREQDHSVVMLYTRTTG
jgi:pullulanase/glycogen debranching enzyme